LGTDLLQKPDSEEDKPRFGDDTPQSVYDGEFDKILKGNYSPEELAEKENDSDSDDSDENQEKDDLEEGGFYKGEAKGSNKKRGGRRGLVIGGGIGALLLSAVFAIMAFLPSFVATHIVQSIEDQIGQVPQYAVEKRMRYYMNRYLINRTLASNNGWSDTDGRYVYTEKGAIGTLYTNWRGAKLENKLLDDYGNSLRAIPGSNPNRASSWQLLDKNGVQIGDNLNASEARKFINDFARKETKSGNIWKRHRIRVVAKNFYGIPSWKPFQKTAEKYEAKKLKFKQKMVTGVADSLRIDDKYSKYINCMLEGGEKCKEIRKGEADSNRQKADTSPDNGVDDSGVDDRINQSGGLDSEEVKDITSEVLEKGSKEVAESGVEETVDKALSRTIIDSIQKLGVRKILASAAAGVGVVDTISQVVQSVNNGNINIITYDKNISQYTAFAAPILSAADQIRSGEDFDQADVRIINETFNNFQESPVYQSGAGKIDTSKSIRRDCNNNGKNTDPEDQLAAGQVVCENKKALQDKTAFTNNEVWGKLVDISYGYENSLGKVMNLTDDVSSWVTSTLKIDDAIQGLMSALNLDEALSSAFQWVINTAIGPVVTGTEVGGDAYDATYAGMDALASSAGGGVGDRSDTDKTIGGQYLNEQQIVAIKNEMQDQRDYELQNMNMFARYFSVKVPESLTSQAIISSPTDLTSIAENMSSVFSLSSLTNGINNIFSKKVSAYDRNVNPFGVMQFGFPDDHPIFTANDGEGMDPDQVEAIYKCSLPANQRPQNQDSAYGRPDAGNGYAFDEGNKLPFDVPTQADPCLLEKAVEEAGSMLFTGTYDDQIDGNSSANNSSTEDTLLNSTIVSGDTSNIPCQAGKDLGVKDGYKEGNLIKIRVCDVQGIDINSQISGNLDKLLNDARSAGINLSGGGYRTMDEQKSLYASHNCPSVCSPPTARPGFSNHQMGLAIDFTQNGSTLRKNNSGFTWLSSNASKYGLQNFPKESWHWSVDGK
jgi:hypothetical protein